MEKFKIKEEILKEVEDLTDIDKEKIGGVESSAIFDGKQYTLKIPKKIADSIGINVEKDKFLFQVKNYPLEEKKKPELTIIYKRSE